MGNINFVRRAQRLLSGWDIESMDSYSKNNEEIQHEC